jgi:hypothetical protein
VIGADTERFIDAILERSAGAAELVQPDRKFLE